MAQWISTAKLKAFRLELILKLGAPRTFSGFLKSEWAARAAPCDCSTQSALQHQLQNAVAAFLLQFLRDPFFARYSCAGNYRFNRQSFFFVIFRFSDFLIFPQALQTRGTFSTGFAIARSKSCHVLPFLAFTLLFSSRPLSSFLEIPSCSNNFRHLLSVLCFPSSSYSPLKEEDGKGWLASRLIGIATFPPRDV